VFVSETVNVLGRVPVREGSKRASDEWGAVCASD
jgi:hypothetical protein